jgi:2-dehydropantoate 2-reductase
MANTENLRAAIYGAGAMGTVLGAYITKAGKQIDLITRNISHVEALKKTGAKVSGSVNFTVEVSALFPEEMTGKYDVIFLMTKQRDNQKTAQFLKEFLADGGVICTTQNGLPEEKIAGVVGEENCVGCAISWGATFIGSGEAALTSSPDKLTFALGTPYGNSSKLELVKPYLECMGQVTVEENFLGARWSKLVVNSAFSSLSAVTGLTFGEVAKNRKARRLAQAILKEGMDAAKANGVILAPIQGHSIDKLFNYRGRIKKAISFALLPLAMKKHKNLVSGMYYDLKNGKLCDIDFVCGTAAEKGRECGVKTTVSDAVVDLAHAIERGECTLSPDNIQKLIEKIKG